MTFDEQCESLCGKFGLSREDLGLLALRWISTMGPDDDMNSFLWWLRNSTQEQVEKVVNPNVVLGGLRDGSGRYYGDPDVPNMEGAVNNVVHSYVVNEAGITAAEIAVKANITEERVERSLNQMWAAGTVHKIEHQRWMPGEDYDGP